MIPHLIESSAHRSPQLCAVVLCTSKHPLLRPLQLHQLPFAQLPFAQFPFAQLVAKLTYDNLDRQIGMLRLAHRPSHSRSQTAMGRWKR
jgi:hypothetical protein